MPIFDKYGYFQRWDYKDDSYATKIQKAFRNYRWKGALTWKYKGPTIRDQMYGPKRYTLSKMIPQRNWQQVKRQQKLNHKYRYVMTFMDHLDL